MAKKNMNKTQTQKENITISKKILTVATALIIALGIFTVPAFAETTQPSSGNVDHALIGKWSSDRNGSYPGAIKNSIEIDERYLFCYEFRTEGTYELYCYAYESRWSNELVASRERGNYRIEGNMIYCTNRLEDINHIHYPNLNHENKPFPDDAAEFTINEYGNLIIRGTWYYRIND